MSARQPQNAVVVGVDGGVAANQALDAAVAEAERSGRPLHILHATRMGTLPWNPERIGAHEQIALGCYERAKRANPALSITYDTQIEGPAAALVTASHTASLIVLGPASYGRAASTVLGATSHQVAAHSRCPVMVTPQSGRWSSRGPVVVGVDAAEHSVQAIAYAFAAASTRHTDLVAVHTWWRDEAGPFLPGSGSEEEWTQVAQNQKLILAEMLAGWQDKYPEVRVTPTSVRGQAAVVLEQVSADGQLLVVGSRGRGGFTGLLLGSVSSRVLHRARCLAVVVPSTKRH
ncbi:universal stress protein [Pedococcus sp.]|uniref:universal stress protein n=1 Tax=Pedococcus sp. TaxID=2860345 RepID=UPI002E14A708|nr:universal stress protein [Pedococcus sp.]